MAGGELDAVMTAVAQLPADTTQVPDTVLADRMRQLLAARAMWFHRPDGTQLNLASAPRSRPPTRGP
jgi:hypothetical protein